MNVVTWSYVISHEKMEMELLVGKCKRSFILKKKLLPCRNL